MNFFEFVGEIIVDFFDKYHSISLFVAIAAVIILCLILIVRLVSRDDEEEYETESELSYNVDSINSVVSDIHSVVNDINNTVKSMDKTVAELKCSMEARENATTTPSPKNKGDVIYIDNRSNIEDAGQRATDIADAVAKAISELNLMNQANVQVCEDNGGQDSNSENTDIQTVDQMSDTNQGVKEVAEDKVKDINLGVKTEQAQKVEKPKGLGALFNENGEDNKKDSVSEAPRCYDSRDCATSKEGRTYTLEELIKQIK